MERSNDWLALSLLLGFSLILGVIYLPKITYSVGLVPVITLMFVGYTINLIISYSLINYLEKSPKKDSILYPFRNTPNYFIIYLGILLILYNISVLSVFCLYRIINIELKLEFLTFILLFLIFISIWKGLYKSRYILIVTYVFSISLISAISTFNILGSENYLPIFGNTRFLLPTFFIVMAIFSNYLLAPQIYLITKNSKNIYLYGNTILFFLLFLYAISTGTYTYPKILFETLILLSSVSSFISIGIVLKDIYSKESNLKSTISSLLSFIMPIILFLILIPISEAFTVIIPISLSVGVIILNIFLPVSLYFREHKSELLVSFAIFSLSLLTLIILGVIG